MVLYLNCMYRCGLHAMLWLHIGLYLRSASLLDLTVSQYFYFPPMSLWNDLADPIFDSVGLAGFKSWGNVFLLAQVVSFLSVVFYYFPFSLLSLHTLVLWG